MKVKENNESNDDSTKTMTNTISGGTQKSNNFLKYILVILIFITIAFSTIYTKYLIKSQYDILEKRLETISNVQENFLTTSSINQNNLTQSINKKILLINKKLKNALKERWYQANDWLMLKASYYLQIAVINNNWTNDQGTTVGLLDEADKILSKIPGDLTIEVRQSIANDQLKIKQFSSIDIVKILVNLDTIQKNITSLPTKQKSISDKKTAKKPRANLNLSDWQIHLKDSLDKLSKIIIIKPKKNQLTPIITPDYLLMIVENIRLNLQQAQWSVINNNFKVYNLALNQTVENISRVFDTNNEKTIGVLEQIKLLQKINIAKKKPNIDASLILLNKIINQNNSLAGSKS
jgi:uroporphyrin-3 C-methyltransferase